MVADTLNTRFSKYTKDLATAIPRTYSDIYRGVRSDGDSIVNSALKSAFLGSAVVGTGIASAGAAGLVCGNADMNAAATVVASSFTLVRTVAFVWGNLSPDLDRDLPQTRALQRANNRYKMTGRYADPA